MRGRPDAQTNVFHTFHVDDMIPADHPLRAIKPRVDAILRSMSRRFSAAYGKTGRPSVPPERLIKAMLLRAIYSIRSDIQLCEQVRYNLLFRWFLDLQPSEEVWTPEVFSMNRERFEQHGFVRTFFDKIVESAIVEELVSEDHFSVDGSLIQSHASLKSLRPIESSDEKVSDGGDDNDPGNPSVNFRGHKRSNKTHRSLVDPEARLARKGPGKPALLSHSVHVLMENRHGLCVDIALDEANGHAERLQAAIMLEHVYKRQGLSPRTLAADGGYRDGSFLAACEGDGITPHVPLPDTPIRGECEASEARRRAKRRMGTKGYSISQRVRKRVEEIFGWLKTIGGLARTRLVQRWKILQEGQLAASAYNLLRIARLRPNA